VSGVQVRGNLKARPDGKFDDRLAATIGERLIALEKANRDAVGGFVSPGVPAFGAGNPGAPGSPGAPGAPGASGVTDHGGLTGLEDPEDHPQYVQHLEPTLLRPHSHTPDDIATLEQRYVRRGESTPPRAHDHLHSVLPGLLSNDHPLYHRKHGFEVAADGSAKQAITYDKATKKITITPTASTFRLWIDGVQFIKAGAQVSGAHGATTGNYYFYYDSAGALQVSAVGVAWSILSRTVTPVAIVYWNNTLADGVCFYESHTADRVLEFHYNLHFSRGCQYISGLDLSGHTLLTDSDAAVTYAVSSGVIADEDIRFAVGATADAGPYAIFWRTGATGAWTWTVTDSFPFKNGGTYPQRNDPNGGGAGVWGLTEVGDAVGRYVNYFICATSAVTPAAASAFLIPGQADHASLAAAQAEGIQSLSLGTLPFEEVAPIWKVTLFCRSVLAGTYNCRIEQVTSLKNQTVTIATSSTGLVWGDLLSDQAILGNRIFGG